MNKSLYTFGFETFNIMYDYMLSYIKYRILNTDLLPSDKQIQIFSNNDVYNILENYERASGETFNEMPDEFVIITDNIMKQATKNPDETSSRMIETYPMSRLDGFTNKMIYNGDNILIYYLGGNHKMTFTLRHYISYVKDLRKRFNYYTNILKIFNGDDNYELPSAWLKTYINMDDIFKCSDISDVEKMKMVQVFGDKLTPDNKYELYIDTRLTLPTKQLNINTDRDILQKKNYIELEFNLDVYDIPEFLEIRSINRIKNIYFDISYGGLGSFNEIRTEEDLRIDNEYSIITDMTKTETFKCYISDYYIENSEEDLMVVEYEGIDNVNKKYVLGLGDYFVIKDINEGDKITIKYYNKEK